MLARLAWRNIFRNKRRTFITGIAIGIGLASLILVDAIYVGMERSMVHSATSSFMGDGQIHHDGFRESLAVETTIADLPAVVRGLAGEPDVDRFAVRTMAFAMLSSPANMNAVSMVGVDPNAERAVSQIDDAVRDGAFFAGDNARDIVVGSKLADLLEVQVGDRVVMTAAEAHTGDLAQEMFRVSGVYHFGVPELDGSMAFVRIDKARAMLGIGDGAHEIALKLTDVAYGRDKQHPLWAQYSTGGNEAVGWSTLLPQLDVVFAFADFGTMISGFILFSIVALGIINTLFMSLHERMFEFGVIRAVGTRPERVGLLVVAEAAALALVSVVIGSLFGLGFTYWLAAVGIDYTGIEFAGVTFRERLHPVLQWVQFVKYPVGVFALTTLIGIYPAWVAARLVPARALRKSF